MVNWITNDIISFFITLVLVSILIPQILRIAFRKNLFDKVDERKVHKGVIPRLGGISFFPTILFSIAFVIGFNLRFGTPSELMRLSYSVVDMCFLICAVFLMFFIGALDDLLGMRYKAKLCVQVLASIFLILAGVTVDNLYGFLGINALSDLLSWFATSFLIVYVVNAINLIDGIDGLASGIGIAAFTFFAIVFYLSGEWFASMLSAASIGALIPFFYYNVFGEVKKQKKIFMGDTGALTIGMILAFCSLSALHSEDIGLKVDCNPVIIAISPFVVPCFDLIRVSIHRLKQRRNPFLPDKSHVHHKLLALGLNQHKALGIIMVFCIGFILLNLLLSPLMSSFMILCVDIAIWTFANIVLTHHIKKREKRIGRKLYR